MRRMSMGSFYSNYYSLSILFSIDEVEYEAEEAQEET